MRLGDVDGDVFGLLVNWIYTQQVEHEEMKKYVPPELQNQVMLLLQPGIVDDITAKALLQHAYEVHESNSLKKMDIKEVSRRISNESFDYWTKEMPESALLDLTRALVARP